MKSKKNKIAYILTPITFGGAEKVSLNFLRTVDRDRFDIKPIILNRPWEEESIFVKEIKSLGYDYQSVPVACRPLSKGRDRFRLLRVASRFHSILKRGDFSVVHAHGYFADICGLPVAKLLGIRTISTCHGFVANGFKMQAYNKADMYALRLCNTIIAVSEDIKFKLACGGINDKRIIVIPNAVSTTFKKNGLLARRNINRESLKIGSDDFVVGYLGRLSPEKGVKYLIQAAAELRDADVPLKVLIIGDGPERKLLEQMAQDLDLGNKISFTGFQNDIEPWLLALDVFVLPSLTEGTPMALLEAMAAGVPIIATAVGGVPNVVTDMKNCLLIPSANHHAIRDSIKMLHDDYTLRSSLGKSGFDTISKKFDADRWCRKIEYLYRS